ncbi:hypothetical protein FA15DRAFT_711699 [Coprinopsis marcescibilis]|uniref:Uncharacterized protein n=1 Tax=Coprinopsis marcescibilis TaxID=230819 RepID=A0A5C3K911_COPMA|nr:hypothetical protein FA15DRAFT_711699 [Coprinopsis marcescibilis]
MSDALSRMYANGSPGTVHAMSEYTYHNNVDDDGIFLSALAPVLVGFEVKNAGTLVEIKLQRNGLPKW